MEPIISFFFGTGFPTLDAAYPQVIAVRVDDVATVSCTTTVDNTFVLCLYSVTGHLLGAFPWPEGVNSAQAAVDTWLNAVYLGDTASW